jgi:hypothetical protein
MKPSKEEIEEILRKLEKKKELTPEGFNCYLLDVGSDVIFGINEGYSAGYKKGFADGSEIHE